MAEPSFWDRIGPGMVQTGGNYMLGRRTASDSESLLRRAQGPLYDQQQAMAGGALNLAQNMDPNAAAAERFGQWEKLTAPGDEAKRLELMRVLQKQGMLGAASYAPVPGTVATPGVPVNPQMAALFAAQAGARERAAYNSMKERHQYQDNPLNRGGMLQRSAQGARSTGQNAMQQVTQKPSIGQSILRGGMDIMKDKGGRDAILAAIKGAPAFVRNLPGTMSGMFGDLSEWLNPSENWSMNVD